MSSSSRSDFMENASHCDGFVCCLGCLSFVPGLLQRVVNQVAFFPPRPAGYHLTEDKKVFLIEADYGLSPLPDLSHEGISVDTVRMWTQRGNSILGFHLKRADSDKTLLFSHGNSTDIGTMFPTLREMCNRLRISVFAYEYSGYGESTGYASEDNLCSDIEAAYNYLIHDFGVSGESIVVYGQSIGSVPTVDLASKNTVGGIILHSAMKSGLQVVHDVKKAFWFDVFQNITKIPHVTAPVFIIHGTHDSEVTIEHGLQLFEACPPEMAYSPWWVKEAGHNDIELNHRQLYFDHLQNFLESLSVPVRNWRRQAAGEETESQDSGKQPLLISGLRPGSST
mmetsp:Transcript_34942/g.75303  ORF Transcript_34942/g.75303 Transcript_34942/m.75303 type:complete len:338 (+) Transcript_34942:109-1122(+)